MCYRIRADSKTEKRNFEQPNPPHKQLNRRLPFVRLFARL